MPVHLTEPQIWLRLFLAVVAGGLLGLNRGAQGHAAGFRTTILVGLAAAATLWVMTVIGLCFGGGQLRLGTEATVLSIITLFALKWLDVRIPREHRANLVLEAEVTAGLSAELGARLAPLGYRVQLQRQTRLKEPRQTQLSFFIHWRRPQIVGPPLDLLKTVNEHFAVVSFETEFDDHS